MNINFLYLSQSDINIIDRIAEIFKKNNRVVRLGRTLEYGHQYNKQNYYTVDFTPYGDIEFGIEPLNSNIWFYIYTSRKYWYNHQTGGCVYDYYRDVRKFSKLRLYNLTELEQYTRIIKHFNKVIIPYIFEYSRVTFNHLLLQS